MLLLGYVPPVCEVKVDVTPVVVKCNFTGAKIKIEGNVVTVEAP